MISYEKNGLSCQVKVTEMSTHADLHLGVPEVDNLCLGDLFSTTLTTFVLYSK